ncbi:MAG: hypothetical protein COS99_03730 [Candidatus Omnitrophica bacterium CG07_land_8_20_14_0_80_42_15]|uniref:CxxC-x17-CxxC domain-containing protein n=1 Tax=Candidatus Aquitaenariimonas noxiae TaxID=1974741 RepID=A0A2J0KTE1_9BACT|nr:MAG: hypothetical protein COS99_03730 [Candidatus Omnitrophica bacterium CG07_land_8_20_14_0_80_42_15]
MQQQLISLEKKVDTLISRSAERPFERNNSPKPFQPFNHFRGHDERRQDDRFRERKLYKVICADCNKECEIPFRPSGDRPVYCKECFSKRKGGGSLFKVNHDARPKDRNFSQEHYFDKQGGNERHVTGQKKKTISKRRKTEGKSRSAKGK